MIRVEADEHGVVLRGDLPRGSFAYLDRDWLPTSPQSAPALVVRPDGAIAWCGGSPIAAARRADPDTTAALVILAVAHEAAAAVEDLPPNAIEVSGTGLIARRVRSLVGERAADPRERPATSQRPRAIVEATGDPAAILESTRRVADLGKIVLVGESLGRRVQMNLYPDVHLRGLTLIGVSPPLQNAETALDETSLDDRVIRWCRECLVRAQSGVSLPLDAAWYVLAEPP